MLPMCEFNDFVQVSNRYIGIVCIQNPQLITFYGKVQFYCLTPKHNIVRDEYRLINIGFHVRVMVLVKVEDILKMYQNWVNSQT